MITNGKFLTEVVNSLELKNGDRKNATDNAESIVKKIINSNSKPGAIGLVYGRIQSGKTRAMIISTAMAFDNGFKIAIVITSNINDLVAQTHLDFSKELKGVRVFTKDDELLNEIEDAKIDMGDSNGRILVVTSKGNKSLKNTNTFLTKIGAKDYKMVIFDDEGDQASLDMNTYKRSSTGDLTLQATPINRLITKLRTDFPKSVYVSVTGTPQAVLLQNSSSNNRPHFVHMLPFGQEYIGGDHFFETQDPSKNSHHLISIIPADDKDQLLNKRKPIPQGLKSSIIFFLLSASAAVRKMDYPKEGKEKDKGFQFLCHPSLKNNEQSQAKERISTFLTDVRKILGGENDEQGIDAELNTQYVSLKNQLGNDIPSLEDLKETMKQGLSNRKLLVINASNNKRRGIEYGPGFNFLIGGNTLGRGIAIPNLLVTYYVRSARTSQIDTMHQHARMFGYRKRTLKYTRLFVTNELYSRFWNIHSSDKALRDFIDKHKNASTYPVEFNIGLRATRKGVLDFDTTEIIWAGMQIYPNYMKLPQPKKTHGEILKKLYEIFDVKNMKELKTKGKSGISIPTKTAVEIIEKTKSKSQNAWHDKTITDILNNICKKTKPNVFLMFREAKRKVEKGGFIPQGTISGPEQTDGRNRAMPTLWIMSVTPSKDSTDETNEPFMYPTIIVPKSLPEIFVFSKK